MSKFQMRAALFAILAAFSLGGFQNCANEGFESLASNATVEASTQEPEDPTIDPTHFKKVFTTYEPLLADRMYIRSLFEDVFGPTAAKVDSTKLFRNGGDFGSACSLYIDQNTYDPATSSWTVADDTEICARNDANFLNAQVNPKPTVTRAALITRACSDLTTGNATLKYAMDRISDEAAVPRPTRQNILTLYNLFYRHRPLPSQGLIDSITVMFPPTGVTRDHWRAAIYAVCASGLWQVL